MSPSVILHLALLFDQTWNNLEAIDGGRTGVSLPSIAFTSAEDGVIAYQVAGGSPRGFDWTIYVKHWNGTAWSALGGALDTRPIWPAKSPGIAVDSTGVPYVCWYEEASRRNGVFNVHVKKWDGTSWVSIGGPLDRDLSQSALAPAITIDQQDRPVVAWSEYNEESKSTDIQVAMWDGQSWASIGTPLDTELSKTGAAPSITCDARNRLNIAWAEDNQIRVKRWNGRRWVSLGDILNYNVSSAAYSPSLATTSTGQAYVSWHELNPVTGGFSVRASRYRGKRGWQRLGRTLNSYQTVRYAWQSSITIDDNKRVTVSWSNWLTKDLHVSRWSNRDRAWSSVGSQPLASLFGAATEIDSDSDGNLYVAYANPEKDLLVSRFDSADSLLQQMMDSLSFLLGL